MKNSLRVGLLFVLSLSGFSALPAAAPAEEATITVDGAKSIGPVNPLVFGLGLEASDIKNIFGNVTRLEKINSGDGVWNPITAAPIPSVLEVVRKLKMGILRYPGGSAVHAFEWKKTIGPMAERGIEGNWKFGLDEFMTFCKAADVEPIMTVPEYTYDPDKMPAYDAEMVEYLNAPATAEHPWAMKRKANGHPEPYGVRYFELGNESNNGNEALLPRRQFTSAQYADYAVKTIAAMKAVDPTIKVGVVTAIVVPNVDAEWNKTVIKVAGPTSDFLVYHNYAPPIPSSGSVDKEPLYLKACMAQADQYESRMNEYRDLTRQILGHTLPLVITEYNTSSSSKPKPYRNTMAGGLEMADLIRVFLKPENDLEIATLHQLLNGYWGIFKTEQDKPDGGKITLKPPYFFRVLWAEHFGKKLVAASVSSPKDTFPGMGYMLPAHGDTLVVSKSLGEVGIAPSKPASNAAKGYEVSPFADGAYSIDLKNCASDNYPELGTVIPPTGTKVCDNDYRFTFEARFIPADPADKALPALGMQLSDSRGAGATGSFLQIKGIGATDWTLFETGQLHTLADGTQINLTAKIEPKHPLSGRLEVRNLKVEAVTKPNFPAYDLITSSASLSEDGKTLYVIVFNKSEDQAINGNVNLNGFPAAAAKYWEVNGPGLGALDGVSEVVSGKELPVQGARARHTFPAHSMTALEFTQ